MPISFVRFSRNRIDLGIRILLVMLLFAFVPLVVKANTGDSARDALWLAEAENDALLRVSKSSGELMLRVPGVGLKDVLAISSEEPDMLWAYGAQTLSSYSAAGELLLAVPVDVYDEDYDEGEAMASLAASRNLSVWLAFSTHLHHFDVNGNKLHTIAVGRDIKSITIDRKRDYLWVITKDRLYAYNAFGELTASIIPDVKVEQRDIVYDPKLDQLWVADQKYVRRYSPEDGSLLFSLKLSDGIAHLEPDYQGGVWVASDSDENYLIKIDSAGVEQFRLQPLAGEIVAIASEPEDSSVWVASEDAVLHLSATGELLHTVDLAGLLPPDDDGGISGFTVTALALFVQYNPPPIADAGDDINALILRPVHLDATQSYDPNGGLLSFNWSLVAPEGSSTMLDDATHPLPSLTPDLAGDYLLELIVNDGEFDSTPAQVMVKASDGIAPPNARAGRDQTVLTGTRVKLDGSASYDPVGLSMSYAWSLLQVPTGSGLSNADIWYADTLHPEFEPDVTGAYDLNLNVSNGYLSENDSVQVVASNPNVAPTAEAGPILATRSGETVTLDSRGSSDPDAGPTALSHAWSLVARPNASALTTADIVDADQPIASFTPDVPGIFVFRLNVDDGELQDGDNTTVITDDTPPVVTITSPADGTVIDSTLPAITVEFSDADTGIDLDSFQLLINGADVTASAIVNESGASYTPIVELPGGDNEVTLRIADKAGNLGQSTSLFTVSIFRAIADCGPTLGTVPHAVTYRTRGIYTEGSIVRYRWDRDGNGSYDTYDTVPRDYSYTFNSSGTYDAVLEVQNNLGQIATDVCTITVEQEHPTVTASATPSNGSVPLEVTFICQGQSPNGSIVLYEWDFDGDGTYDYSSAVSGTTTRFYDTVGEFAASCRVTDSVGLTGVSGVIDTTVRPRPEGSPTVTANATPTSGVAPLVVNFSGDVIDDGVIVRYEWDFDGDSVFDYSSTTSANVSHTYQAAGIFAATLRVTDDTGLTSLDAIAIDVDVTASLSIADDTFLPDLGETVSIKTVLSGSVPTRLRIKDDRGVYIRTLVDELRAAGTYYDAWDGRNDNGVLMPDGVYYTILEYDVGGETRLIDLTYSTGGIRYNPSRTSLPRTFDPYENDPLSINFTLNDYRGASEVLAFVGLFYTNTRLVTLLDREPFGVGTHTIYWDGLLPDGSFAVPPPGDYFLFGIWGYTLPNNAVYLSSAPKISNFSVQPTQHSPARDGSRPITVTFDLDKNANIELSVENLATGRMVYTSRYTGYTAGASKVLEWDGLNSNGFLPDKGEYRLAITAIDSSGGTSLTRYMLLRIFY